MEPVRLITVDPGHFHAALIQKEMYPEVSPTVHVYAPLGADLAEHLARVARFNARPENPTCWELEVHAGADFLERFARERPGNVVVLSGRNRGKVDRITTAIDAGLNVLADKPWIIEARDLPKLEAALGRAEAKGLVAYDIMTERYEITSILQRELVQDREVFGEPVPGDEQTPGVFMESVHHLCKTVAGAPLLRPVWFFDIQQQGEGLSDVGTHLVDLAAWTLFPEQSIAQDEVELLSARRWPTVLSRSDFQRVTGERLGGDQLEYYCNTLVSSRLREIHVQLNVLWNFEAPAAGGDTHLAVYRGSKSRVEVRQGPEEGYVPQLYVLGDVADAVRRRVEALQTRFPGIGFDASGKITIPNRYRVGHEAHFGQVVRQFLQYLKAPPSLPKWEKPNMLAKYFITTKGVEMARKCTG